MPQYHCDFGNTCEMFKGILKSIMIANQENRPDKINSICMETIAKLEKWQKVEILRLKVEADNALKELPIYEKNNRYSECKGCKAFYLATVIYLSNENIMCQVGHETDYMGE